MSDRPWVVKKLMRLRIFLRQFVVTAKTSKKDYLKDAQKCMDGECVEPPKRLKQYETDCARFSEWLGREVKSSDGRRFLSLDSRDVCHNPLYNLYKIHSSTTADMATYFILLNLLNSGVHKLGDLVEQYERIREDVDHHIDAEVRTKMGGGSEKRLRDRVRYLEALGLAKKMDGASDQRCLNVDISRDEMPLEAWKDAINYYSEISLTGVVGSYLLDRLRRGDYRPTRSLAQATSAPPDCFSFKHRYLHHALDAEVFLLLLQCIHERKQVQIRYQPSVEWGRASDDVSKVGALYTIVPLKICMSVQTGRAFILAWGREDLGDESNKLIRVFRVDRVIDVLEPEPLTRVEWDVIQQNFAEYQKHTWGVAWQKQSYEHIEMTIQVPRERQFIVKRLFAEKRCGSVSLVDGDPCRARFVADVTSLCEVKPWIRSFMGYITSIQCSDENFKAVLLSEYDEMLRIYGIDYD